jgi:hypothetical protein
MTSPRKPIPSPRFDPGGKVRVRRGVTDPIFPDIPLGGWSGTIKEIEQFDDEITYEIGWDERTLDGMHPVFRKRCERDGLETETMWLDEEYIEPDDGTPVTMEQPTEIRTPPLSMKDQDDRIRAVFGLTHDDPLPDVGQETLRAYHRYLMANLRFPFTAIHGEEEIGPFSRKRATMAVTGLIDPEGNSLMEEDGLICAAHDRDEEIEFPLGEIEVKKKDPNFKLVSDYSHWFHNRPWRDESPMDLEEFDQVDEPDVSPPSQWGFIKTAIAFGIAGGILGATIGAALRTIKGAGPAAMIGGIPPAMIGAWSLGRYGFIFGVVNRINYSLFLGVILGLLGGGLLGVVAGLMMVAFPWSLAGAIAGALVGPHLMAKRRRRPGSMLGAVLGILGGTLVAAFRQDPTRATAGANSGLITGMIVGAGMFIALTASSSLCGTKRLGGS